MLVAWSAQSAPARSLGLGAWVVFIGLLALSLLFSLLGQPALSLIALALLPLWALHEALFRWITGISLLLLVLFFVPSRVYRLPLSLPFDLDPYRLVLLFLLLVWLIQAAAHGPLGVARTHMSTAITWFLGAVVLSYAVNATRLISASELAFAVKTIAYAASFPLTFYVIASKVRTTEEALKLVDLLVICGGLAGVFAVLERVTHYNVFYHLESFMPLLEHVAVPTQEVRGAVRVAGATAHPIAFSTALSMLLPLSIVRAFEAASQRVRWSSGACALFISIGALLALSRTGIVGIVAAGAILMFAFPRHRALLTSLALGLTALVHLLFRGVIGTFIQFLTPSNISVMEAGNDNGRLADYAWALPQIVNRPLFGLGFGALNPERSGRFIDNQYLAFSLEIGILGMIAFLYLMWRGISVPLRAGQGAGEEAGAVLVGIAAASAAFAVASVTFDTVGFPQVTYLFFALAALASVVMNGSGGAKRPSLVDARRPHANLP